MRSSYRANNKKKGNIDIHSFEKIFKNHYHSLCVFARKFVIDEAQAEDIVQDTFIQFWEKRESIKIVSSLRSYLFKCVYNHAMNYLKRERVKEKYASDALTLLQEEERRAFDMFIQNKGSLIEQDIKKEINNAIEAIPEVYKKTFKLSRSLHLKNKEIANILDIPVRTVETHLYRSLIFLREKLKHHLP